METNREKSVNNEGPEVKLNGKALLIYDLKHRKLIPTKILFFVVLSSKLNSFWCYIIVTYGGKEIEVNNFCLLKAQNRKNRLIFSNSIL